MTDTYLWLIGNRGMLGTELALLLEKSGLHFAGSDFETDIADPAALENFAAGLARPFGWIINCAAYTAVDRAEDDAEACRRLNTSGAANIAACAKNAGARLIHFSTDYVFDGKGISAGEALRPYRENDETCPAGVYGLSKRDGELAVFENNPRSYIIRTAWLYGGRGNNFVHTMLRLMNERDEVKVVNDQFGSPTRAFDLAAAVITLIKAVESSRDVPFGVYHYTNEGNITWFDFAKEIFRTGRELGCVKKDCSILPCASSEYPARVKRPAFSVLDKSKIKAALGLEIPFWDASLKKHLAECGR